MFDTITQDDLVVAFYPCIYFCETNACAFTLANMNYRKMNDVDKISKILARADDRQDFYKRLIKFVAVCVKRGIRMVFENPYSKLSYLHNNFLKKPSVIDRNRMLRGDYFVKPTAYWFWNCEPTYGESYQQDKERHTIRKTKGASEAGICSEDRSLISTDYARNWICDFVLGKSKILDRWIYFRRWWM